MITIRHIDGFMIAAQWWLYDSGTIFALIRSPGHIYVLITNVINTYALVKYILYIINMCLNKVISLLLSLSLSLSNQTNLEKYRIYMYGSLDILSRATLHCSHYTMVS